MASESSELTFVRCPSCRSLVPASASRCRICNNPLEASGAASGGDAAKTSGGRVRQRTISAQSDELLAAPDESAIVADEPIAPQATQAPGEEVDPLSAFLEELDDAHESPAQASAVADPAPVSAVPSDDVDPLDLFADLDGDPLEEAASHPIQQPMAEAHANNDQLDHLADLLDEELIAEPAPEPTPPPAPPKREPPPVAAAPAEKREIEQPRRDPPRQQQQQHQQAKGGGQNQKHDRGHSENRGHREGKHQDGGRDGARHEKRHDEHRKGGQQNQHQHNSKHGERSDRPQERAQNQGGPKMGKMRPGRLFGWLVSFESPDGRAIELREGKFFVTGTSIRGTDLVVEDPSISTPHALMSVSSEGGLLIQDLMSDRGVFVRSGDRGQYQREDGIVHVSHGDWIRFGDVEFLVTIVPSSK